MPVDIRIYEPPQEKTPAFRGVGRTTAATAVSLIERHFTPGCFSIEIPSDARHAQQLLPGRLVLIDGAFWGILDDLARKASDTGDMLSVSGRQLKGLTMDRLTIPPSATGVFGAQGYDPASGSTETVMKHFASANLCSTAQRTRAIFGLEIAPDQNRGLAEDKYMSRHEVLADVLAALGEASGLGYDIVPVLKQNKLLFDVVAGMNHTAGQSERKRVIFDVRRKTALSQAYARTTSDSRNVFYTTLSGSEFADETMTVTYLREGETEPVGILRREKHLNISADTPVPGTEYNELKRLALLSAEEFKPSESFSVEVGEVPYHYRTDYAVGDLVTLQNKEWGITTDVPLTQMETQYTQSGLTHTATFGTAPLNVLSRLKRQIVKGQ